MPDINVNKLSEVLNTKADIDLNNTGVFSTSEGGGVNLTSSTPANASGKEVTSADFIKSNLLNYTTNGILEIPQDIKLELNNGTLTLKAGSKVYVPNGKNSDGSNKFDAVTIENDVTYSSVYTSSRKCYALYDYSTKILQMISLTDNRISYDSTTNKVIHTALSDTVLSFPFALVVRDTTGISSIEQVFNGFGYIGSTVFALPGVKGAIPNGRNEDGTLKNTPIQTNVVRTTQLASFSGDRILLSNIVGGLGILYDLTSTLGGYNYETNLIYRGSGAVVTGQAEVGKVVMSNGVITSFQIKTPFHAVDYNDFAPVKDAIPTKQDIATAVNYDNITNCITEIPQDIKLELNNGTLTLKAGSKVYVPNGPGVFDVVTVPSDVVFHTGTIGSSTMDMMLCCNLTGGFGVRADTNTFVSGSTAPSNTAKIWYDTTNNAIKAYEGGSWVRKYSLPIGIYYRENGNAVAIKQIFNGFGYIGSTAFALPGVKVLIPNGRNADGTLKNIEFVINNVITRTITWNNAAGQELFIGKYNLNEGIQFISTSSVGQYYKQETEPSLIRYAVWYKPAENKVYRCDLDSNGNLIWKDNFPCYIGQWFTSATSPYPITKLTIRLPFHAVDWNDSSWLSGLGMPSGKNIKLTVGASRTTYTAPANGWFYICVAATANGALYNMFEVNGVHGVMNSNLTANCSYKALMPIIAGRSLYFEYNDLDFTSHDFLGLWFIYAHGEQ